MEFAACVSLHEVRVGRVHHVPTELRVARDHEPSAARKEDEARNLQDGIPFRLLRGAERLSDLTVDILGRVVQEDARIRL